MTYWQVAAGMSDRDYSITFLEYGLMCIGSDYPELGWLRDDMDEGDIVILKKGAPGNLWEILAVGEVADDECWDEPLFDDVEGWELPYARRVKWKKPIKKTVTQGLTRGTLSRCYKSNVQKAADEILKMGKSVKTKKKLPKPQLLLTDDEIIEELIKNGFRPGNAEEMTNTIRRIRLLANWYESYGCEISEHETRSFLIIPILQALGWAEQQLKLEWTPPEGKRRKIDIAFFRLPYFNGNLQKYDDNSCLMILESKAFDEGLSIAEQQAQFYAKEMDECKRIVISNGYCYKIMNRVDDEWKYVSYLNLLKPRKYHPIFPRKIKGAHDVFLSLMPNYL